MLHEFSYIAPDSLSELLGLLSEHGRAASVFSDGTDLFVTIRAGLTGPTYVIDLKKVAELHELSFDDAEGLSIGACITVNELVMHPAVTEHYPVLEIAGNELATFQLRNRATVVGRARRRRATPPERRADTRSRVHSVHGARLEVHRHA